MILGITQNLLRVLPRTSPVSQRCIQIWKQDDEFNNINIPEKWRLPLTPKIPSEFVMFPGKVPRGTRENYRILGEERIHNKLLLGQYGIVSIHGGYLEPKHFDMLRNKIGRYIKQNESFAILRVDSPYKPWTRHGQGKKLGGGKGAIDHYRTPVKAGRVIVEIGGKVYWEEVRPWLSRFAAMLPFEAIAVNVDILERLDKEEERLNHLNQNPISFEWFVRNNMFDCQRVLSPYDRKWFGKFLYKDRHLNKKWNEVLQSKYTAR